MAEGAETLQTVGKVKALVTFRVTPIEALLLKASHRQSGSAFSTVFKPEQHVPSGFETSLPLDTKDKQSAMLRMIEEQSTEEEEVDGDGAAAWLWAASTAKIEKRIRVKARENFDAAIVGRLEEIHYYRGDSKNRIGCFVEWERSFKIRGSECGRMGGFMGGRERKKLGF